MYYKDTVEEKKKTQRRIKILLWRIKI